MCGRFANNAPIEQQAVRFDTQAPAADLKWQPSPNCAPQQTLPIIFQYHDHRLLRLAHWGFTPDWAKGKALINARGEEAAHKATFKDAFQQRRCLVPAAGYYEWKKEDAGKQPYFIRPTDQQLFGFAGLWQTVEVNGQKQGQFTVMTVQASPSIAHIHERMPVILSGNEEDAWLEESLSAEDVQHFCEPYPDDLLAASTVSTAINTPTCQDWSLLDGKLS